jgi:hypothetical protein
MSDAYKDKITVNTKRTEQLLSKHIVENGVNYWQYKWKSCTCILSLVDNIATIHQIDTRSVKEYDAIELLKVINRVYTDKECIIKFDDATPYIRTLCQKAGIKL